MNLSSTQSQSDKFRFAADVLCILLLIAGCLSIGLPRYHFGINFRDEGFLAYGGVRVLEGQVPNRDFVSLQPPLSFYTVAILFKLFGTSLASLRVFGLALYVIIALSVYGIARHLVNPAFALLAAIPATVIGLPYVFFTPLAVWQGITATLIAIVLYLRAAFGAKCRWLALPAGIITAASLLLRQDQGLYLVVSLLVFTVVLKLAKVDTAPAAALRRISALWAAGILIVAVPFGIYCWARGAVPGMFAQLIVFPLTMYAKTSSLPFPGFSSEQSFGKNMVAALFYVPPVLDALAAIWLAIQLRRRSFGRQQALITLLLVWSSLFYCQVLARSDLLHLVITLTPFFVLGACGWAAVCERLLSGKWAQAGGGTRAGLWLAGVLSAMVVVGVLVSTSIVFLPDTAVANEPLALERAGGVRVARGTVFTSFVRAIQKQAPADQSILCLPYQPMLYFLCERRNPTRWNNLWPGDQTTTDHEALIRQARRDPPSVVVLAREAELRTYAPEIVDYIHAEYALTLQIPDTFAYEGPWTVYVRPR